MRLFLGLSLALAVLGQFNKLEKNAAKTKSEDRVVIQPVEKTASEQFEVEGSAASESIGFKTVD